MATISDQAMHCTLNEAYEVLAYIRTHPSARLSCASDPQDFQCGTWTISNNDFVPLYIGKDLATLARKIKGE